MRKTYSVEKRIATPEIACELVELRASKLRQTS